ncbi:MAG: MerR family transcriptional regulator [Anaerolineales bacterium]|jgi:methanogenic corrinoid protein MtbC1
MSLKEQPTYNLKVVVHETGIKPDTLRAWERRYGLPEPARTEGGHRIYSPRDIEIIKWLINRQKEGLSISRAVKLWQSIKDEGRDPLQDEGMMPSITTPETDLPSGSVIEDYRESWVKACLDFNGTLADSVLTQAFAIYPIETVSVEVLQKGLADIGSRWYMGEISVQQEHYATALAHRRINSIISGLPDPTRSGRILVGCPPEEEHSFPLLLITLLLRLRSWDVIYLGANVPVGRFKDTMQTVNPRLIVLAAQQLYTASTMFELIEEISDSQIPIAYGGLIFSRLDTLKEKVPAHFLGEDLQNSINQIEHILSVRPPKPTVDTIPNTYLSAYKNFSDHHSTIESALISGLESNEISPHHLALAQEHLTRDIKAALRLGNMNYIDVEIDWIKTHISYHDLPAESIEIFLVEYRKAIESTLSDSGRLIIEWFDRFINNFNK